MRISAIWLAPLSFLYGIATRFRNYLYNIGYSRSFNYDIMVIAVGNLSVGGTGKSPMTEYLIRLLHKKYSLATLSRGYKRKTKGFLIADEHTKVEEIGDEPFQMYLKYNKVTRVAVGEERSIAIPNILLEHPETQVILMDDGFQHRTVSPDFSILLTAYGSLFYNDHLLPWGRLREARIGAKRAQTIIVTKCPQSISEQERQHISEKIRSYGGSNMPVFFTKIIYGKPKWVAGVHQPIQRVVAFAGLANTDLFEKHLKQEFSLVEMVSFNDHHNYNDVEILELADLARKNEAQLITTEKDVVKFREKKKIELLGNISLNYVPIEHQFIKNGNVFDEILLDAITEKYTIEEE